MKPTPHEEVLNHLEAIEANGMEDRIIIEERLTDLEQHGFFTGRESIAAQLAVRHKIDEMVIGVLDQGVEDRLIALRNLLASPIAENPTDDLNELKGLLTGGNELMHKAERQNAPMRALVNFLENNQLMPGGRFGYNKMRFEDMLNFIRSGSDAQADILRGLRGLGITDEASARQIKSQLTAEQRQLEREVMQLKSQVDQLNQTNQTLGVARDSSLASQISSNAQEISRLNKELGSRNARLHEIKGHLEDIAGGSGSLKTLKLNAEQLLRRAIQFTDAETGQTREIDDVQRIVEDEIQDVDTKRYSENFAGRWTKAVSIFKPTLTGTLEMMAKEVKGFKEANLDQLANRTGNREAIAEWIEERGADGPKQVATIMAYLDQALVMGSLNGLSRNGVRELLENLRIVRDQKIAERVKEEHEKPADRLLAFEKARNAWDVEKVKVNQELIKTMVNANYAKVGGKIALGATGTYLAWPYLSAVLGTTVAQWGMSALGLGWGTAGKAALIGGNVLAHKITERYHPKKLPWIKHGVTRATGAFLLGGWGLFAPEAITLAKATLGNKERLATLKRVGKFILNPAKSLTLGMASTAGKGVKKITKGSPLKTKSA
ncbi:hypothetical protein IPJ72_00330 [Candidatus Peregrinibacteria bacterium]|nr:MAG: hypothetical protein IPJ72_00330 [Candidatus Peregrinibacteria bacterium]